jgi:hypothetical protein
MSMTAVQIAIHPKKGQTEEDCKAMAEGGGGAFSYDAFGQACWKVFGKAIQINPIQHSIKEGAMITNINFNAQAQPAVASPQGMSSAADGTMGSSGWHSDGTGGGTPYHTDS